MRAFIVLFSLLLVALAPAQSAKVPKEIRKIYTTQLSAWRKGDFDAFFSYFDPKFEYHTADGNTENLAEFRKAADDMVKNASKRTASIKYTGCNNNGDTVDVIYIATFGMTNPTAKPKHTRLQEVGTDTWKKTSSGWKLLKTVDKSFGPVK